MSGLPSDLTDRTGHYVSHSNRTAP